MRRYLVSLILVLADMLGVGCQATPGQRLIAANDLVTTAYTAVATAREAGVVTQADINKYRPVRDAIDASLDEAGRLYRQGDVRGMDGALSVVRTALVKLAPLINKGGSHGPGN